MSTWSRAPSLVNRMCSVHCLMWAERRVVLVTMMWSHPLELWTSYVEMLVVGASQRIQPWCEFSRYSCEHRVKMQVVGASHKERWTTMTWIHPLDLWTSCENAGCWCESQGEMYNHDVNSSATVVNILWKCSWVIVKSVSEQRVDLKSYHFRCKWIVKVFVVLLFCD